MSTHETRRRGRLLFCLRIDGVVQFLLGVGLIVFCILGMYVFFEPQPAKPIPPVVILNLVGVWLVFGVVYFLLRSRRLEVYEHGIRAKRVLTRRTVLDSDADSLTWDVKSYFVNGVFVGLLYKFAVKGTEFGQTVSYYSKLQKNDAYSLESYRIRVSRTIAREWLAWINRGNNVTWNNMISMNMKQVKIRHVKLFGRGDWIDYEYSDIIRPEFGDGRCSIFVKGSDKAVLTCPTSVPNFWPMLFTLEALTVY